MLILEMVGQDKPILAASIKSLDSDEGAEEEEEEEAQYDCEMTDQVLALAADAGTGARHQPIPKSKYDYIADNQLFEIDEASEQNYVPGSSADPKAPHRFSLIHDYQIAFDQINKQPQRISKTEMKKKLKIDLNVVSQVTQMQITN